MKGMVYTLFQDMVEDEFGLEVWEYLLEHSELASEGIYTSGQTYPDEEIQQLIARLSIYSQQDAVQLIEHFGHYMLPHLMGSLPATINRYTDLWSFLAAIHDVIHIEVKKLSPDAMTPDIKVIAHNDQAMTLSYQSPRKLCFLAIGLVKEAGVHFNMPVNVNHGQCMHNGNAHCVLNVSLIDADNA